MAYPFLLSGGSTNYDTQEVYTASGLEVGTIGILNGRSYVWCSYTGSDGLNRAEPLVSADITGNDQNLSTSTSCLALGQVRIDGITAGGTAIDANAYNDGFLAVVDGGAEGTIYSIERSLAFTASAADGHVFLKDGIKVASDASTEVSFIKNKYADPQQSKKYFSGSFVGVPNVAVPDGSSTTQYFWAQRTGYCPVFIDGTPKRGTRVMISTNTDGRLASVTPDAEVEETLEGGGMHVVPFDTVEVVGVMVTDAIDGEVQIVDLQNAIF